MNILIIGCGHLGSRLANVLDSQENDVAVIDRDESKFDQLNDDFSGITVRGNPIDADAMVSAGIEGCDVIICVTESDNSNLMAAQIAKKSFNKTNVIVRVLDPLKSHVYEQLGVFTVCPTSLAFESICASLYNTGFTRIVRLGYSSVEISVADYEKWMKGKTLREISNVAEHRLLGFMDERNNMVLYTPAKNREVKENDKLVFATLID